MVNARIPIGARGALTIPNDSGRQPLRGFQRNRVHVPAVVRFLAMHRATVAVKTLVGIGIDADVVDHQHARILQPHPDKAGEIEHRMACAFSGDEEQRVLRVSLDEPLDEFAADFIGVLSDQGTDGGDDAGAFGAEFLHRLDRRFHNAGQRALPARMRRADHARARIDQKDRPAIGRGDADGETCRARHDGVGARPRRALPWTGRDHRVGRMDLVHAEKMRGVNAHLLRHPAAVLRDMGGHVVRAEAAIEAFIDVGGDAAVAGEESVAQPGNRRQQRRAEPHGCAAPAACASSSNPASAVRWGSETASTLNIDPMPPRPPPISRCSAPEMSSETSWLAFAIRLTARVSMPSRFRKSPCGTGPWTRPPRSSAARARAWKSTWAVTSAWPGFFSGSAKLWRAMAWKVSPASLRTWPSSM